MTTVMLVPIGNDLLEEHSTLAALQRARRRCPGSGAPAVAVEPTRTYITIAWCMTCSRRIRVKTDGRLRAHHGRD